MAALLGGASVSFYAAPAAAQQASARNFDIPAGDLDEALRAFADETGLQMVFSTPVVDGMTSPGVSGSHSPGEALSRLLAGTGLTFSISDNRTVTIYGANAADGERVTGAVRVEGTQGSPYFGGAGVAAGVNGINGSRDITATEGTGSFTSGALTIGSKVPQAMKDVPQSVSVLTSELIEQKNIRSLGEALDQMPGVTVLTGGAFGSNSNQEVSFYSRGFALNQIQVDGGAPLLTNYNYNPQIEIAQFDHVELLRGASGTFSGYGSPSGTVNLVRKKPLDHAQVIMEAQAGSWNNYRLMLDATTPLALGGALRGRLVTTWQDNEYFYDVAEDNKVSIYGLLEYDASPTTLLTAGASHIRQDSVPWQGGLPRYLNGDDLELPRSTAFAFPWNRYELETTEFFGAIEQKLGGEWTAKLNLTYLTQDTLSKIGWNAAGVNPYTGKGPRLTGAYEDRQSEQFTGEFTVSGAFEIFGQRQEIVVGASRSKGDAGGGLSYGALFPSNYQPYPGGPIFCTPYFPGYCPDGSIAPDSPPIDVFDFDPNHPYFIEPQNPLPVLRSVDNSVTTTLVYANLRLTAFDRLHLTTGLRYSQFDNRYVNESLCDTIPATPDDYPSACFGKQIGDVFQVQNQKFTGSDFSWPPSVTVSYDLTKDLTAFVGYTDIYVAQDNYVDGDLQVIGPLTGANWEGGVKWAPAGGRFNVSLSAYHIRQKGFAADDNAGRYDFDNTDPDNGIYYYLVLNDGTRLPNGTVAPGIYCCYVSDPKKVQQSTGFDLEVTGEITPGWQISTSYTYSDNKTTGVDFNNGKPFASFQPKHLYKLWTSYDFGAAGHTGTLAGLTISGGINGRSAGFNSGSVCANLLPPDPVTGQSGCVSYSPPDYIQYKFSTDAYTVVSARIDYRFSPVWSLAVNLDNIFDTTYYQVIGYNPNGGSWYGKPRNVTATLRAKW